MSKATAKSTKVAATPAKSTAKKGQKSKAPAPVIRPQAGAGFTVLAASKSAAKAGAKPSEYYPQGDVALKLLPKTSSMGSDQQKNWDAIHGALGGVSGKLPKALAKSNAKACTRRHIRRLARAGFLSWK